MKGLPHPLWGWKKEEYSGGRSLLARGPTALETPLHLGVFPGVGRKAADAMSELLLLLTANCWQAAGVSALESSYLQKGHTYLMDSMQPLHGWVPVLYQF